MEKCLYCGIKEVKLFKHYHWNKEGEFDWYCEKHIKQVRNFSEDQKIAFIKHFEDPNLRQQYLSEEQRRLYDRLVKEL